VLPSTVQYSTVKYSTSRDAPSPSLCFPALGTVFLWGGSRYGLQKPSQDLTGLYCSSRGEGIRPGGTLDPLTELDSKEQ